MALNNTAERTKVRKPIRRDLVKKKTSVAVILSATEISNILSIPDRDLHLGHLL